MRARGRVSGHRSGEALLRHLLLGHTQFLPSKETCLLPTPQKATTPVWSTEVAFDEICILSSTKERRQALLSTVRREVVHSPLV